MAWSGWSNWGYGGMEVKKMTLKKKFKVNVKQRAQFEWLGWSGLTGGLVGLV